MHEQNTAVAQYPEHDKLSAVAGEAEAISEFIEWLEGEGILFARYGRENGYGDPPRNPDKLYPLVASGYTLRRDYRGVRTGTPAEENGPLAEILIARCFGIDRHALEAERRSMLAAVRALAGTQREQTP